MDPRDLLRPLPDGAACTACGATVPAGRIRILARRDDVAFVELACHACGSDALGLLITPSSIDGVPLLDVAGEPDVATSSIRPISSADVDAVRADLAAWTGDLVDWLARLDGPPARLDGPPARLGGRNSPHDRHDVSPARHDHDTPHDHHDPGDHHAPDDAP